MTERGGASQAYLDRYDAVLPIRTRHAFRVVSARRVVDGRPCVVVLPGVGATAALAEQAFIEIEAAHSLFSHPSVPRVSARGSVQGTPFLEFDCPAVIDGFDLVKLILDSDSKIPFDGADAFIFSLREAASAAHEVPDPKTGKPLCLGRISLGNVIFDPQGRWYLVGFGRNFPIERADGHLDPDVACSQAPELASGGASSPAGDYVSISLFMRSVMPFVDMSGGIGRLLRGEFSPADAELLLCLQWLESHMMGVLPPQRATVQEAVAVAHRIRALNGTTLDPDAFASYAAGLMERVERDPMQMEALAPHDEQVLTLGPDVVWVAAPDGTRHRLGRAHRRILRALIEGHRAAPAKALTVWDLLRVGWPGEQPHPEAGANRVYVALARIRQLGLRDLIERFDDGYRIAPRTVIVNAA